jgi:hypothetical protein
MLEGSEPTCLLWVPESAHIFGRRTVSKMLCSSSSVALWFTVYCMFMSKFILLRSLVKVNMCNSVQKFMKDVDFDSFSSTYNVQTYSCHSIVRLVKGG